MRNNSKSFGKLIADEPGRYKKREVSDKGKEREDETVDYFEYDDTEYGKENHQVSNEPVNHQSPFVYSPPPQPVRLQQICPFQQPQQQRTIERPIDEAEEWIHEFTAEQAHQERLKQDNDDEEMAIAAADLLSQMDLESDEKLRDSKFVAYLKGLARGQFSQMKRAPVEETLTERANFAEWRDQYGESIGPLVTEEERAQWDQVVKDWQYHEAEGLGYSGFAERLFSYQFMHNQTPEDNPFHDTTAERLAEQGETGQAILAYEAIVQNNTNPSSDAWYRLGQLQMENEQDILAIAAFRNSLGNPLGESINHTIYLELASCLVNEQCRPEALNALREYLKRQFGISVNEDIDAAHLVNECLRCYNDALTRNPNAAHLHNAISILHCISGEYENALQSVEAALALLDDPSDVHYRLMLENRRGAMHANLGNYTTALNIYDAVLRERPSMARAHYNRGVSLFNAGDYEAAIDAFATALHNQQTPSDASGLREDIRQGLDHVWDMLRLACEMANREDLVMAAKLKDKSPFMQKAFRDKKL